MVTPPFCSMFYVLTNPGIVSCVPFLSIESPVRTLSPVPCPRYHSNCSYSMFQSRFPPILVDSPTVRLCAQYSSMGEWDSLMTSSMTSCLRHCSRHHCVIGDLLSTSVTIDCLCDPLKSYLFGCTLVLIMGECCLNV